jgi:alpha-L-fucosidase
MQIATTRKGKRIYLHVFNAKGGMIVLLPMPFRKVMKVFFPGGAGLDFGADANGAITVHLPDKICQPIIIQLDGNAADIPVITPSKL